MGQLDLISRTRADKKQRHRLRAYLSSFVFHALLIGFVIEVSLLWHTQLPLENTGSTPGAPVISLQTIVIVSQPAPPTPVAPILPSTPVVASVPMPITAAAVATVHPETKVLPPEPRSTPHPEVGVPVLAGNPTKPVPSTLPKTGTPTHTTTSTASSGGGIGHLRPTGDKFVSSYAPGVSSLPHPPYPAEARDLQQTGVVRMLIKFDAQGNVARADVVKSSGVAVLDTETRSFIYTHWHSAAYAGKAVSVPVEYTLTSL